MLLRLKNIINAYVVELYFCLLSRLYLMRWRPEIIVITGAVGKTSVLNLLKLQFGQSALHSHKANTKVGITCHILNLPTPKQHKLVWLYLLIVTPFKALFMPIKPQQYYLVEYDVADQYSTKFFKWWLKPQTAVCLSVAEAHLAGFTPVARRLKLTEYEVALKHLVALVGSASEAVFALDDSKMKQVFQAIDTQVIYVQAGLLDYEVDINKTSFKFDRQTFVFSQPMPRIVKDNLALMRAVCQHYKIDIKDNLGELDYSPGRSTVLKIIKESIVIDSTYNAQLSAFQAILEMFKSLKTTKNKWLIMGYMIEQGDWTQQAHQILAQAIVDCQVDRIFIVGRRMKEFVQPILADNNVDYFWQSEVTLDFIDFLKSEISGQEVILIKGSGYLDMIVEALLYDKRDAIMLNNPGRLNQRLGNNK